MKLPSQFTALVLSVRAYLEHKAFGRSVALDTPDMVRAVGSNVCGFVTIKAFVAELRKVVVDERTPELVSAGRPLSSLAGCPWSRPTVDAAKCVFNRVACDNYFEAEFARFLQDAEDVTRFAKLPEQFGFVIGYTDTVANLRHYEPDFVAVTADGTHYLVETKGQEDVTVAHKDRAARLWCENATTLTGTPWAYFKVRQADFKKLQPTHFSDLLFLD